MKTFAISLCLLASVAPALAQPSQGSAASIAAFDRGRKLMKSKQYAEACEAFERSQELEAAPGTLYNLATCYVQLGKLASAWAAYRQLSATDPNVDRRAASADAAIALDKRLPRLLLRIAEPPPDLVVTLNGFDVTSALGIDNPIDLGTHTVVARATGFRELALTPHVTEEGKTVTIDLALVPRAAVVPARVTPAGVPLGASSDRSIDTPPEPGSRRRIAGLVVVGIGGALGLTGGVFGLQARSEWQDAQAACPGNACPDPADLDRDDRARDKATLSTVFLIAGGVAAVTGIGIYLSAPRAGVHVTPTPNGLALGGSF